MTDGNGQTDEHVAQTLEEQLDAADIQFTEAMQARVMEQINGEPANQPSFWNREVRIPIPLFAIPIVIAALLSSLFLGSPPSAPGKNQQVIVLPTGVFSSAQLGQKG